MILMLILLSIGVVGGVLFFPVNFDNQYTCLYHRMFVSEHHYDTSNEMANTVNIDGNHHEGEIDEMMHSELLDKYVLPFGLIWWISLIALAIGFFWLKRGKSKIENLRI